MKKTCCDSNKVGRIITIIICAILLLFSLAISIKGIVDISNLDMNICVNAEKINAVIKKISGGYIFTSENGDIIYGVANDVSYIEDDSTCEINIDTVTKEFIDNNICYIYNENTDELFNANYKHNNKNIKIVDLNQYQEIYDLHMHYSECVFLGIFGIIISVVCLLSTYEKKEKKICHTANQ